MRTALRMHNIKTLVKNIEHRNILRREKTRLHFVLMKKPIVFSVTKNIAMIKEVKNGSSV